ncbi:hypothetical protein B0H11DRAFT_2243301 [Mycena galericulata]|nr:hypothetical protein B0H11DRAFT_2243301 [Mycena galericulata]
MAKIVNVDDNDDDQIPELVPLEDEDEDADAKRVVHSSLSVPRSPTRPPLESSFFLPVICYDNSFALKSWAVPRLARHSHLAELVADPQRGEYWIAADWIAAARSDGEHPENLRIEKYDAWTAEHMWAMSCPQAPSRLCMKSRKVITMRAKL